MKPFFRKTKKEENQEKPISSSQGKVKALREYFKNDGYVNGRENRAIARAKHLKAQRERGEEIPEKPIHCIGGKEVVKDG
ncbi:hypothetical protein C9439_07990 [archaeon SCG-AAA382B04]|nr:hypothetical protein C9439_07990 [archaeon SCG-AAA382B04]